MENATKNCNTGPAPSESKKNLGLIILGVLAVVILVAIAVTRTESFRYNRAVKLCQKGEVVKAIVKLEAIKSYSDLSKFSGPLLRECRMLLQSGVAIDRSEGAEPVGVQYFKAGAYYLAHKVLKDRGFDRSPEEAGYLGLIHLYGFGVVDADARQACHYIFQASDTMPFLVHKGDLQLWRDSGIGAIEQADAYYKKAAELAPDDEHVATRYLVTSSLLASYHDESSKWQKIKKQAPGDRWENREYYSNYVTRYISSYWNTSKVFEPHGWGYYTYKDRVELSKFTNGKSNGPTVVVWDGDGDVFVGRFKNDRPASGCYITDSGEKLIGEFDPKGGWFELKRGVRTDFHGRTLQRFD